MRSEKATLISIQTTPPSNTALSETAITTKNADVHLLSGTQVANTDSIPTRSGSAVVVAATLFSRPARITAAPLSLTELTSTAPITQNKIADWMLVIYQQQCREGIRANDPIKTHAGQTHYLPLKILETLMLRALTGQQSAINTLRFIKTNLLQHYPISEADPLNGFIRTAEITSPVQPQHDDTLFIHILIHRSLEKMDSDANTAFRQCYDATYREQTEHHANADFRGR